MSACGGYRAEPLGGNRQMVAASAAVGRESNTIHLMTEVDITGPRRLITEHREHTGERLSLTGYVVACLARTLAEFPRFNSFRRGSRLIVLDDLTISVLFEREIDGENVPEPVGIQAANRKTHRQVNDKRGRRSSMRSSGSARRREPSGSGSSRASCLGASSGWRLATSACRSGSASSGRTTRSRGTRRVFQRRCRGSRALADDRTHATESTEPTIHPLICRFWQLRQAPANTSRDGTNLVWTTSTPAAGCLTRARTPPKRRLGYRAWARAEVRRLRWRVG